MNPEREKIVFGHKVEEFYWGGRLIVYVDNYKTDTTFEQAVERLTQTFALK